MADPERSSRFKDVKQSIVASQDVLQNTLILSSYSLLSVLFLFLFHFLAARYLGPEEYSVLGVFASVLFTVFLMSGSIFLIVTRFVSYHHTRYQYEQINYLIMVCLKYFFAAGFLVFIVLFIFSQQIAVFFNISNPGPVVMLGFAIWLQLLVPVYEAAFKGLDNMHAMGRMRVVEAFSRWVIALFVAYIGLSTTSMVFALGFGTFISLAYSYVSIRELMRLHIVRPNMQEIWDYAKPVVLVTVTIALLLNLDIILVKHFFPPEAAGVYAAASLLAKIPFILSWIFATVIFPRVTKLYVDGRPTAHLLRMSLKWMSAIVVLSTLFTIIFSGKLFPAIFGSEYSIGPYIGLYAFSMGLLAIVNILSVYQLALKRFTLAKILPWFLVLEILLFSFFHTSLFQIVTVTVLITSLLVAATLYVLRRELNLEYLFNE